LTEKEKEELITEWKPEPLVPPLETTSLVSSSYSVVSRYVKAVNVW